MDGENEGLSEYISRLSGLELAKYVLLRLINDHESIETIAEDFDDDQRFISGVVDFLDDIDWIRQDMNGVYRITTKGKDSVITRQRPLVSLSR
jgi:predicted transcriptional regulator